MSSADEGIRTAIEWTETFLAEARFQDDIDEATYATLRARLLERRLKLAVLTPPVVVSGPGTPVTKVEALRPAAPTSIPMPPPPPAPSSRYEAAPRTPVRPVRRPSSPVHEWFERVRGAIASDVAVHGLAYLGVVLVFGGTLGFMLYSFNTLPRGVRPLAELAIPTVLLGSAMFLRHRGSPVVATALGLVGGILLPVVLFASYADSVPPDLHGAALAAGVTITSLALAAAYAMVASRRPEVSVRFLVAPMLWMALWGVGLMLQPGPEPSLGDWAAWQFALVALGVAGTAAFTRARPAARFSRDTIPSLIPGALIALGFGLLLAGADGWPVGPVVVLGLASLVTSELIAPKLGVRAVQLAQPALLWVTIAGIREGSGDVAAGVAGSIAALALLEWQARRRPGELPMVAGAVGVAAGLALTGPDPRATAIVAGIVSVWLHVRRIAPLPGRDVGGLMGVGAAVLPVVFAAALMEAIPDGQALVALAAIVVATSAAARTFRPSDAYFGWWSFGAAVAVLVLSATLDVSAARAAAAAGASTVAIALSTMSAPLRAWTVVPAAVWTSWIALEGAGISGDAAIAIIGVTASAIAGVVTWRSGVAEHVAASSAVIAACAVAIGPGGWLRVEMLVALVLAVGSVTVAGELRGRGAAGLLARLGRAGGAEIAARSVPPALLLVGLAALGISVADATGLTMDHPEILGVLLVALALAEGGTTWLVRTRSPLREVIGLGAFVLAIGGVVVATTEPVASALSLVLAIGTVTVLAPESRLRMMPWAAWAATIALVDRAAVLAGLAPQDRSLVVAAWSSILLVGGLGLDDLRAGRRSAGELVRERPLIAPVVLGAACFLPALAIAIPGTDARIAAVSIAGAVVIGIAAWQLRLAVLAVGSYILATAAATALSPWPPYEHPFVAIPWAGGLAILAIVSRPSSKGLAPARRWDLPPSGVALAAVLFALVRSAELGDLAATWIGAGFLSLGVSVALRSSVLGVAGAALVTVGAMDAGPGWGALAAALSSIGLAWLAVETPDERREGRVALQAISGLSAGTAIAELGRFAGWSASELAIVAAMLAGVVTLSALAVWMRGPRWPWLVQAGFDALAFDALAAWSAASAWPNRWPLVAVLLVTAAGSAAAGIVLRKAPLLMAAPPLVCAALLVGAQEMLQGHTPWFGLPIGLTILAVASIGRWDRRRREFPPSHPPLNALEYAGMVVAVAPFLAETLTVAPARGLVAVGLGLGLSAWGVVTKVRRRLIVGAVAVVAAVVLMIAGPIAELVPRVEGATLWVLLVLAGLAMLAIATSLERGRAKLSEVLRKIDERLEGWE